MQQRSHHPGNGRARAEFERLVMLETDEHVLWPFSVRSQMGYGQVYIDGVGRSAHAVALERRVGAKPERSMYACHAVGCPTTCMNYRHLRWDTPKNNQADRVAAGTTARGRGRAFRPR